MKSICLMIIALAGGLCMAQSTTEAPKEPPKFYKLDFAVRDLEDGKVITTKNYSMMVQEGSLNGTIRAGSKIEVGKGNITNMVDVGTNIDCRSTLALHDSLSLLLAAEVTLVSVIEPNPIIRQNKWSSMVVIPLKKPTVVFSSDDSTTKQVMQLEVTATPIKP